MALDDEPEKSWGSFARRIVGGLIEAAAVLAVATAAGYGILYFLRQQHLDLAATAPWFAAIVSSFSLVAFYVLNRRKEAQGDKALKALLGSSVNPRTEIASRFLDLELDAKTFRERRDRRPESSDEMMLLCCQIKGDKKYSTDEIRDQMLYLRDSKPHPNVKWAVFVTNENEFVAFQEFDTFLALVLNEQAKDYREALNTKDPAEFKRRFIDMKEHEARATSTTGLPAEDRVLIFGLNEHWVNKDDKRQDMIKKMKTEGASEAMMIGKKRRPIGVVRLTDLIGMVLKDKI